jgi:hypothetical protein
MIVFKHNHVIGKTGDSLLHNFTAHFSATRKPGVVLRVSSILVFVPSSNLTKLLVLVAMADIRCIEFKTILSAFKMNYLKHKTPHHHI